MIKSSVEEIKLRFDHDVERFSNIHTGQISTIDADISLELITESAKRIVPNAKNILDLGCGAGNYSLKMLSKIKNLNCTLIDLSKPMLDKALERVTLATNERVEIIQGDIREIDLSKYNFDIILAGAVLHHLRDDKDWEFVFNKLFNALNIGGCLMIADLITQNSTILTNYIWEKYGNYLENLNGIDYKNKVLDYIEKEDSPRSLNYQLDLMKKVGFSNTEILHKNVCFAAYCGIK